MCFNLTLAHSSIPLGMHLSVEKRPPPPFPHPVGMRLKEASLRDAMIFLRPFLPKETSLTGCEMSR